MLILDIQQPYANLEDAVLLVHQLHIIVFTQQMQLAIYVLNLYKTVIIVHLPHFAQYVHRHCTTTVAINVF